MIPTRSFAFGPGFSASHFARYYAMRLVPFARPRRLIAASIARRIAHAHPQAAPRAEDDAPTAHAQAALAALARDGWSLLPALLSAPQIVQVRDFLAQQPLANGLRYRSGDALPGVSRAAYPLATVLACPHLLQAINGAGVLDIATRYLGCRPTLAAIGLHWSFPAAEGCDVQRYHRDPDDWRFVKLFCYLSDVDAGSGPHQYVATSHLTSSRFRSRPYSDAEVEQRYGRARMTEVVGPAGTTFMADTWGIHRGQVPTHRPRLMLQATYSLLPVAKFVYTPQPQARQPACDAYVNRLLVG